MLSRAYLFFIGFILVVMSIAGYMAPQFLGAAGLETTVPTVWLVTGLIALAIAFVVRSVTTLRWTAGIIGALYLLWGILSLFTLPTEPLLMLFSVVSMMMVAIGAAGLAVALAPAYWVTEQEMHRAR